MMRKCEETKGFSTWEHEEKRRESSQQTNTNKLRILVSIGVLKLLWISIASFLSFQQRKTKKNTGRRIQYNIYTTNKVKLKWTWSRRKKHKNKRKKVESSKKKYKKYSIN